MTKLLQSDRLSLSEVTEDDLDLFYQLDSDSDVMKYIGPTRTKEEIAPKLKKVIAYQSQHDGLGLWLLRLKSTNEFIGWGCLKHLDDSEEIEVGYRLLKKHWGKGYATEFSRMIIKHGFKELGLRQIVGITHPEHVASQRVLKKVGLTYKKMAVFYGADVKYFTIINTHRK